jgi:hypothetical protein
MASDLQAVLGWSSARLAARPASVAQLAARPAAVQELRRLAPLRGLPRTRGL